MNEKQYGIYCQAKDGLSNGRWCPLFSNTITDKPSLEKLALSCNQSASGYDYQVREVPGKFSKLYSL